MYAQLCQQPLARTTETSLERSSGTLSCLSGMSAQTPDAARTRPRVVAMFLGTVPFLYSKRTAVTRSLVSRMDDRTFCRYYESILAVEQPWRVLDRTAS